MKYLLIVLVVCFTSHAFCQGDFILLRKNNTVILSYFKGSYMNCQLNNGQWIEGTIKSIKEDSIYLEQIKVQQVANFWGMPRVDTFKYGLLKLSLKDIHAFPYKEKGLSVINNGTLFTYGAAGYIFLNLVNNISQNTSITTTQNLTNLGIASGVFLFGEILNWTHPRSYIVGKKYQLSSTATIPVN